MPFCSVSWPATPALTVDAQVARLKYKGSPNSADLLVLRGNYALSKRTSVYAALGHIANDGTLAVSVAQEGLVRPLRAR